jgi:hypothetical protein
MYQNRRLRASGLTPRLSDGNKTPGMARDVTPPRSSIARPGRKYVSGIIYLSLVLIVALSFFGIRSCLG